MIKYKVIHKAAGLKWAALPDTFETFEKACEARAAFGDEAVVYSETFFERFGTSYLDGCESVLGYTNQPIATFADTKDLMSAIDNFNEWEQ